MSSSSRAVAPTGAEQPASSAASTARSASTAIRRRGVVERPQHGVQFRGLLLGRLDRERALAGRGRPADELEELGHRVEPAEASRPAAASTTASRSPAADPAEAGVDVAADVDDLEVGASGLQLGHAAGRTRADPRAGAAACRG